jgi:adenosylcobinamide-phosphate synthase
MGLEYQIALAVALDLVVGDPRWFPHPVRLIGHLAMRLEGPARRFIGNARIAGVFVAIFVVILVALATWGLLYCAGLAHPALGDIVSVYLLYSGLAAKDMVRHSSEVYQALDSGSLTEAKRRARMICGRDTDQLDESGVAKATVESVAENMVDGVTAPLFYAFLAGPVGMMAYKAVNTLDSTFGYKNQRFLQFGWASARLDDLANLIPARITAMIVPLAAKILGERSSEAFQIFLRDRGKHPSPNAGQTEAAMAGALGIQLGGLSHYGGEPCDKPRLGDPLDLVQRGHILRANSLFVVVSGLFLVGGLVVRGIIT